MAIFKFFLKMPLKKNCDNKKKSSKNAALSYVVQPQ